MAAKFSAVFACIGLLALTEARADTINPYTNTTYFSPSILTVQLSDVSVSSSTRTYAATVAVGALAGNDVTSSDGDPLRTLLNSGGIVQYQQAPKTDVNFTSGLFDVYSHGIVGTALGDVTYSFGGKQDFGGGTTGTITLPTPVSGTLVVSLKASTGFAVYGFSGLDDVTTIQYDTRAISTGKKLNKLNTPGLSHSVFFYSNEVPEPSTMVGLAGMGLMGLVGLIRRRGR